MSKKMTAKQLRNLPQYADMTEEEIMEVYGLEEEIDANLEIDELMRDMEIKYDLVNLAPNDIESLRDLCKIFIRVRQLDEKLNKALGDTEGTEWYDAERIGKVLTSLRRSASEIQRDLHITRKARRGDKDSSVSALIENFKKRAKEMLQERLSYIYCPKCKMLLANTWFLYPDETNLIKLTCNRTLQSGEKCGEVFTVSSQNLSDNGNRNLTDVLPV